MPEHVYDPSLSDAENHFLLFKSQAEDGQTEAARQMLALLYPYLGETFQTPPPVIKDWIRESLNRLIRGERAGRVLLLERGRGQHDKSELTTKHFQYALRIWNETKDNNRTVEDVITEIDAEETEKWANGKHPRGEGLKRTRLNEIWRAYKPIFEDFYSSS
ncbi:hypothetical protein KQI63_06420 [bacterium]|nr:hypothetical protein [bacterium]